MSDARDEGMDDIGSAATDEGAGPGTPDPVTGLPAGESDLDDTAVLPDDPGVDSAAADPLALRAESLDTVTNDAVAGETVLPGRGDGNDGPTGGAPTELEPILPVNELDPAADIHRNDERAGKLGSGSDAG